MYPRNFAISVTHARQGFIVSAATTVGEEISEERSCVDWKFNSNSHCLLGDEGEIINEWVNVLVESWRGLNLLSRVSSI